MKYDFFNNSNATSNEYDILMKHNLKSAALFYLNKNLTLTERAGMVVYESYKALGPFTICRDLPDGFINEPYITGDVGKEQGLDVSCDGFVNCNWEELCKNVVDQYDKNSYEYSMFEKINMDASIQLWPTPSRYFHGGFHNVCDIEFLLHRGYVGYIEKIEAEMKTADFEKQSFLRGLLYTLYAFVEYIDFCSNEYVKKYNETGDISFKKLSDALKNAPKNPCKSFYEAVVVIRLLNVMVASEFGRLDQLLFPFYEKSLEEETITKEAAAKLLDTLCYFMNRDGIIWHMVIGGCNQKGDVADNELTEIILNNIGNYAQPNISLRVSPNTSDKIWRLALEKIGQGKGNPALVNEELYISDLINTYHVAKEDAFNFAFGGCSELIIPGKCNTNSTWTAYNIADILNECIYNNLEKCNSFNIFMEVFKGDIKITINEMVQHINYRRQPFAVFLPSPVLSLHTSGCIESGKTFANGGAIYNFDTTDIFGLTNVINSLAVVKEFFEGKLNVSAGELVTALKNNFETTPELLKQFKKYPKFGNGNAELKTLASEIAAYLFDCIIGKRLYPGDGYFLPSIIQWITFTKLGKEMNATLDGRRKGEPLADSCGAMAGTDIEGPTALMVDAAVLPQGHVAGTLVLNVKLNPECFKSSKDIEKIKLLCQGYFELGGGQIQINVIDEELLKKALKAPEEHKNIIVRVGGFTDFFYKQEKDIQKTIVKRISHNI